MNLLMKHMATVLACLSHSFIKMSVCVQTDNTGNTTILWMGNESPQHWKLNSAKTNGTNAVQHKVHTIKHEMSIYK